MADPYPCVGGTYTFRSYLVQNGSAYNLTGLTVRFILTDPTGTATSKTPTVEDTSGGIVSYTTVLDTDLTLAGRWTYYWKVTGTSTKLRSRPKAFNVQTLD